MPRADHKADRRTAAGSALYLAKNDVTDRSPGAKSSIEADRRPLRWNEAHRLTPEINQRTERRMMNSLLDCGANGWLMIAGGVVTYGVLALAGAALIKHLFFGDRSTAAGQ